MKPTYEIGHKVIVQGVDGTMSGGRFHESEITGVRKKYNEDTGEPFFIYEVDKRWWEDGGHGAGGPYKSNYMYDVVYDEAKWLNYLDSIR